MFFNGMGGINADGIRLAIECESRWLEDKRTIVERLCLFLDKVIEMSRQ